ncbi:hypothetical protein [Mycobacterium sp. AZCC_0083]|uniref:hypothetical protein n=1 Tax=Mycobacterium sp. AZCC_0083 TaxID=2735882 RepID=UPI001621F086|nr:hypothetical protein [Mycobacterium sp. AZCC_0083]MBB5161510.1 hypothetical protein [Mycobacterium sp. AZCC_0083]
MPTNLSEQFRLSLHHSLTTGRVVITATGLGPHTINAISAIAQAHPDASSQLIIAAYEAFGREHVAVHDEPRNHATKSSSGIVRAGATNAPRDRIVATMRPGG